MFVIVVMNTKISLEFLEQEKQQQSRQLSNVFKKMQKNMYSKEFIHFLVLMRKYFCTRSHLFCCCFVSDNTFVYVCGNQWNEIDKSSSCIQCVLSSLNKEKNITTECKKITHKTIQVGFIFKSNVVIQP